jgi:hypothetical protein
MDDNTHEAIQALMERVDAIEDVLLTLHLAERKAYDYGNDYVIHADQISTLLPGRPPMRVTRKDL